MLNDATMATIPMVRNNPDGDIFAGNGNAGMWRAVAKSGTLFCQWQRLQHQVAAERDHDRHVPAAAWLGPGGR